MSCKHCQAGNKGALMNQALYVATRKGVFKLERSAGSAADWRIVAANTQAIYGPIHPVPGAALLGDH